ncbi:MAG: N-formylglutamate amidohydrolase [Amaricoccus sp.]
MERVFEVLLPEQRRSSALFNSPHSGSDYTPDFLRTTSLGPLEIRSSEDAFVDELFAAAPAAGAPLMRATVPRACLDLNRAADDLDPALIAGTTRRFLNPRIAAGLGVIPRVVADGRAIVSGKLPLAEAQRRIAVYWQPYHDRLAALLAEQQAAFGEAILYDCHSMPHDALASVPSSWGRRPDLVLGDRFGASCDRWLMDAATDIFSGAGFVVARNTPFAGGYITQTYGRPAQRVHALQIEIDRALYMDEALIRRRPDFADVQARIATAVAALAALGIPRLRQVAAE